MKLTTAVLALALALPLTAEAGWGKSPKLPKPVDGLRSKERIDHKIPSMHHPEKYGRREWGDTFRTKPQRGPRQPHTQTQPE